MHRPDFARGSLLKEPSSESRAKDLRHARAKALSPWPLQIEFQDPEVEFAELPVEMRDLADDETEEDFDDG
jgi:hypothetical protein